MNANRSETIIVFAFAALTSPTLLLAQDHSNAPEEIKHHVRYKVVDTGTFGGPNSHMSNGAHILTNDGTFTGYADTTGPDPYAPDGCWDGDCIVAHAFRWKDGKLTDLGVVDGGPNSETNWISENGLIVGDSQNGLLDPLVPGAWEIRGVLWKNGKVIETGTLGGGTESLTRTVNSSGEVVGFSTTNVYDPNAMILSVGLPYSFQTRAFRWKNGVIKDLGTLGGSDAMALGINERGQIIGNSYTNFEPSPACSFPGFASLTTGGFLWEEGHMVNLGSLGGTCTGVSAINNCGQVVGTSFLEGDQVFHPFLWQHGRLTDLGTRGGASGAAGTLNDAGDVVGWQATPEDDNVIHATLWSHGQITDLGALALGECSVPFWINSRKQVVGVLSRDCRFQDPNLRAFLWEPGGPMVDLNALISHRSGVELRNAVTMNDRGEIAAVGWFPDDTHRPVLLIPCGHDAKGDADCEDTMDGPLIKPTSKSETFNHPHVGIDRALLYGQMTAVRRRPAPKKDVVAIDVP
jgi:probable HAF family extracellular repeat protein